MGLNVVEEEEVAVVVAAVPVVAEVDGEVLPDLILVLPVQALEAMLTKKVKGKKLMDSFAEMTMIVLGWMIIWNAKELETLDGLSILVGLAVKNLSENAVAMMDLSGMTMIWNANANGADILEWVLLDSSFSYLS